MQSPLQEAKMGGMDRKNESTGPSLKEDRKGEGNGIYSINRQEEITNYAP